MEPSTENCTTLLVTAASNCNARCFSTTQSTKLMASVLTKKLVIIADFDAKALSSERGGARGWLGRILVARGGRGKGAEDLLESFLQPRRTFY